MCRFNLILTCDERAVRILEKNGYHRMFDNIQNYAAYQKGYCNCGSCVGGLIDKKGKTFEEAIAEIKKERLERLYQIKDYMYQPGYEERKVEYIKKTEELFQAMIRCHTEDFTEENPEYQAKVEILQRYQMENELMQEASCYYKTEEEECKAKDPGIPLNQIIELPEEMSLQNMPEDEREESDIELIPEPESFVIDLVISRTEKNNYQNYKDEFEKFNSLFHELLNEVPDIIFATIWSEPGKMELVKTVPLDSLRIEDLVYLNDNEMILLQSNRFNQLQ